MYDKNKYMREYRKRPEVIKRNKAWHKIYCEENKEKKKRYDKEYNQRPDVKEKHRVRTQIYRELYPKIIKARKQARQIKIPVTQLCEECNDRLASEKHHPDYDRPLDVKFLCRVCHKKVHKCGEKE